MGMGGHMAKLMLQSRAGMCAGENKKKRGIRNERPRLFRLIQVWGGDSEQLAPTV